MKLCKQQEFPQPQILGNGILSTYKQLGRPTQYRGNGTKQVFIAMMLHAVTQNYT